MNPSWRRNYQRYKAYLLHTVEEYHHRKDVKLYLELILSLVAIVIFATLALRPTLLTIVDLFKQIDSKRETIAIMDEKLDNLEIARQLYSSQENSIGLLSDAIPDSSSPQQIINQIEGLNSRHGFRLITMSIGETDILGDSGQNGDGLIYSINSQAEYENLYRMLKDVERLRRPNIVNSLSITRSLEDDSLILVLNAEAAYFNSLQTDDSENEK